MPAMTPSHDVALAAADYYRDAHVQERIREDCGRIDNGPITAAFVSGLCASASGEFPSWERSLILPPSEITALWAGGYDLARSLWDVESLVFLLDIDYRNPERPMEPFEQPDEVFTSLEPVYAGVRTILDRHGLDAMAVVTGRGYHFTGRIPLASPVVSRLARLVPQAPPWWATIHQRRRPGITASMTREHARAAVGLGLLVELLAHQVLSQAQPESPLPIVLNGTEVGVGARGRASISFDFSYAGDALDVRQFRVLFGAYQWPHLRPDLFGRGAAEQPPVIVLPRARPDRACDLGRHRSIDDGRRRARWPTPMPDVSLGVASLVDAYDASPLSVFHRDFLERRARPNSLAPPLDRSSLPPCVLAPFDRPNDLLLKPAHIQHVVRVLMAHGWDPVDIAQRVQAAYAEDHGWGDRWTWMDRQSRADFDVRVFAGLVATNHDTLVDLNCVSAQEKGVCAWVPCAADLRDTRDQLGAGRGRP